MRNRIAVMTVFWGCLLSAGEANAVEGFLTRTFGNGERCEVRGVLRASESSIRIDLSSLSPATKVWRAVLHVNPKGHAHGAAVRLVPAGLAGAKALALRAPRYESFDATECVRAWVARPEANHGLAIEQSGGLRFGNAVLEVSIAGAVAEPLPTVAQFKALHQFGQTFLTWKEIEDPVGEDAPRFEDLETRVLQAGQKRNIVYRIYRHRKPISVENLGEAELIHEIPAVLSAWNLLEIEVTEHPNQGTPTKHSSVRPGYNLALRHVMHRYRITPSPQPLSAAEPLPRGTGLAVLTARSAGTRYYAVTVAADGREAVTQLGAGASLAAPVQEKPNAFPAIVYQRTHSLGPAQKDSPKVDVYNSWLEPPYNRFFRRKRI